MATDNITIEFNSNKMKEYKITEEQIKEAHSAACYQWKGKIESWFPECFKSKLEVGCWYKLKDNHNVIVFYKGENCGYGMSHSWEDENNSWGFKGYEKDWQLATESEVFEMLKKEAEKRGLVKGVKYKSVYGTDYVFTGIKKFTSHENKIYDASGAGAIFDNGKWATIVETPKEISIAEAKEIVEKQLGHKVKIVS